MVLMPAVSLSCFSAKISLQHKEKVNWVVDAAASDGCSSCLLPAQTSWITSLCRGFGKERTKGKWSFYYFPFHLQQTSFEERLPSRTNEHFDWKPGASHVQENTIFPTFLFHVKGFANRMVSLFLLAVLVWLGLDALKCPISVERWMLSAGRRMGGCDWKELIGQHHCSGDLVPRLSPRETRKE